MLLEDNRTPDSPIRRAAGLSEAPPPPRVTDSRLAGFGARAIRAAFERYRARFDGIVARARERFEKREWEAARGDSIELIETYRSVTDEVVAEVADLLAERVEERSLWVAIKAVYSSWIDGREDWELAETFFNSVTRRIFATVGVDPGIEFVDTDFEGSSPLRAAAAQVDVHRPRGSLAGLITAVLERFPFDVPYEDCGRDAALVAARIDAALPRASAVKRIEVFRAVLYRGRAAYVVGRIVHTSGLLPVVIALDNSARGIAVDAVLLEERLVSVLFSFAHTFFRVLTPRPSELVRFIASVIPHKRVAELYISLGFHKHGKTELYRDLLGHLAASRERFVVARGKPGMVMVTFTMPGFDMVFKVIRDRFAEPKSITRREVMERYRLVFTHDRAGRLIDAQEFEHLEFHRRRFDAALLAELLREASHAVSLEGEHVVVRHAYVERRLTPLDLYLEQAAAPAAREAILDYGTAIKELMATNIFPGDLLLKNFGVTRHGRVVFYDFDELCLLTECNFRRLPEPRTPEDELAPEPWFSVAPNDVFPEEFEPFLGLPPALRAPFHEHHGDLFDPALWRDLKARLERGELPRVYPYPRWARL